MYQQAATPELGPLKKGVGIAISNANAPCANSVALPDEGHEVHMVHVQLPRHRPDDVKVTLRAYPPLEAQTRAYVDESSDVP